MMRNPAAKYHAFPPVKLVDRNWPNRIIDEAADLDEHRPSRRQPVAFRADECREEDAHVQALCEVGFKEIEVAFPSASETEFGFVRGSSKAATFPTTSPSKSSPRPASTSSAAPSNRSRAPAGHRPRL
jgi:2-isopropylmalate synthase